MFNEDKPGNLFKGQCLVSTSECHLTPFRTVVHLDPFASLDVPVD